MILTAIKMITKRFEITVVDPITRAEFEWFEAMLTSEAFDQGWKDVDCSLSASGLILLVEGVESIYDLISVLAEHEFMHDIGLIKEISDYEPQFEEEMLITVDLNDN